MKLICRKCDKEIEAFKIVVSRKDCNHSIDSMPYRVGICIECHGQRSSIYVDNAENVFNSEDHGTIHFFEKDEPGCEDCDLIKGKDRRIERKDRRIERLEDANEILRDEVNLLEKERNRLKSEATQSQNAIDYWIRRKGGIPLTWSKAKPTEVGQWFYRPEGEIKQIHWHVYRVYPIGQLSPIKEGDKEKLVGFGAIIWRGIFKYVDEMGGEWAGPIPEPGEK